MSDIVVLVNEKNEPIGTAEKNAVHNADTPLHRGFSVFLFNRQGQLLLQQRSASKKTWPGVWSNSCCGHPMLGESNEDAAKRRLSAELGITDASITMMHPDYRYRFARYGVVENEFCPVMVAFSDQKPSPNPNEVENIRWIGWDDWVHEITTNPQEYSEWCVEETGLLTKNPAFQAFLQHIK